MLRLRGNNRVGFGLLGRVTRRVDPNVTGQSLAAVGWINPCLTAAPRQLRSGSRAAARSPMDASERIGGRVALLTLGKAARLTGLNKTTLSRAIKAGRLSATRRDDGGYLVEPAELERVYAIKAQADASPAAVAATGRVPQSAAPPGAPETAARIATLEAQVQGLEALLTEVRAAKDLAQEQNRQLLAALPPPPRRPWWPWWPWRRSY
jgi:hypothetical protein